MKLIVFLIFSITLFSINSQTPLSKTMELKKRTAIVKHLIDSIESSFCKSDFTEMKVFVDSAKKIVVATDAEYYKIKSYQAVLLNQEKSFEKAVQFSKQYLKKTTKLKPDDLIRFEYAYSHSLSYLESYQNKDVKKIVLSIEQKLNRNKTKEMRLLKIRNLLTLSNIYYYEAKYDSVSYILDKYRQNLLPDEFTKWADYYVIKSNVEVSREHYQNGMFLLKRASSLYKKANDEFKLIYTFYNTGDLYRVLNAEDSVFYYFGKAKELALKHNNTVMLGYISTQLGDIYLDRKEYDLAFSELKQSEQIFYEAKNHHGLAHCLLNLALLESDYKGNQANALEYANEALKFSRQIEDGKLIETCYEYLYTFHEKNGDDAQTIKYLKLFHEQNLKITGLDVQANIDAIEVAYKTKLFKERNKTYKHKINEQRILIQNQWIKIIFLVIGVLIVGLFSFFIYKNHKKKVRIHLISKELDELKIAESENNQRLLISELNLIQKTLKEKSEINKLLVLEESKLMNTDEIKKLVSNENDWVNFILKIKLLFPGFIEKLEEANLNLSINEFRLAALVRFNLSDKEIAELLCIELSSVKKAKVRLKKKLNLNPDRKLMDYLKELGT